ALPRETLRAVNASANLGRALLARFDRGGAEADRDEAITALRVAVAGARHPLHAEHLFLLGDALRRRGRRTWSGADLTESVEVLRTAVETIPEGAPDRVGPLAQLAAALRLSFTRSGSLHELAESIELAKLAVASSPDAPADRPVALVNAGASLW